MNPKAATPYEPHELEKFALALLVAGMPPEEPASALHYVRNGERIFSIMVSSEPATQESLASLMDSKIPDFTTKG